MSVFVYSYACLWVCMYLCVFFCGERVYALRFVHWRPENNLRDYFSFCLGLLVVYFEFLETSSLRVLKLVK